MRLRPALVVLLLPASPLPAVDFLVTLYADPAPDGCTTEHCSLREALLAANAAAGADRILLSAGIYAIQIAGSGEDAAATGDLDVTDDLDIVGPGASMTSIDGNAFDRIVDVFGATVDFTLKGVTLYSGEAGSFGSAIMFESIQSGTIEACEIRGNLGSDPGQETAAVELGGSGYTATIRDTTIRNNTGAGLLVDGATALVENSTFYGNTFYEIAVDAGELTCTHCTIFDDSATAEVDVAVGASLALANTLVVGDCAPDAGGLIDDLGGSLESPGTTCEIANDGIATNLIDPGEPGDHGGPTPTVVTAADSPSVGAADDALCLATDQRGAARPEVDCDVGAVELESAQPPTPVLADGFEQGSFGSWIVVNG